MIIDILPTDIRYATTIVFWKIIYLFICSLINIKNILSP